MSRTTGGAEGRVRRSTHLSAWKLPENAAAMSLPGVPLLEERHVVNEDAATDHGDNIQVSL